MNRAPAMDPAALGAMEAMRRRVLGLDAPPRIGERYEPGSIIGAGGMGLVLEVTDHQLGRRAALKVLRGVDELGGTMADELRREARALAQVNHPNVVPVFDIGIITESDRLSLPLGVTAHAGAPYLVMELVDGCSLGEWLEGPVDWERTRRSFVDAARGLAAAHAAGIVHRDFKPANVLVSREGTVKVGDFGIALSVQPVQITARFDGGSEESLEVIGTPMYMAPEQLRGEAVDARADQFAWCVALYRTLLGRSPYPNEMESMLRAKEHPLWGRQRLPDGVPSRLWDVLIRGLHPEPEQRFASMEAVIDAMAALDAPRPRWPWVAAGVPLALVGAALVSSGSADCPLPSTPSWAHIEVTSASEVPGAEPGVLGETVERALAGLENQAAAWEGARTRACGLPVARREQATACLQAHYRQVEAVASALTHGGSRSQSRTAGALEQIGLPDHCVDDGPPREHPTDPRLRAELAELETLVELGQLSAAWGRLIGLVERARHSEDPEVFVRALIMQATLGERGTCQENLEQLSRAYYRAAELELAAAANAAARNMASMQASCLGDAAQSRHWFEQARAWQHRAPEDAERERAMLSVEATVLGTEGKTEQVEAIYRGVLEQLREGAPWQWGYENYLLNYMTFLGESDRVAEAVTLGHEVIARLRAVLGAAHPSTAEAMVTTAIATWESGNRKEAAALLAKGIAVMRGAYGPDHRQVVISEFNEVLMAVELESAPEIIDRYDRLLPRLREQFGEGHEMVTQCELNRVNDLVRVAHEEGDRPALMEAARTVERMQAIDDSSPFEIGLRRGYTRYSAGRVLLARGRFEDALKAGREIIAMAQEPEEINVSLSWRGHQTVVFALLGLDRNREAAQMLTQMIEMHPPGSDRWVASTVTLAEVLAVEGRYDEAQQWLAHSADDAEALERTRSWPTLRMIRAFMAMDDGRLEDAGAEVERGLEQLPERDQASDSYLTLAALGAEIDRRAGREDRSRATFEQLAERCRRARDEDSPLCLALDARRVPGRSR